jgi:serine kinase of HPr protein (carbohydrate metabolism regulator)
VATLSSETLHASSVAIEGTALLIMGPSGSGKSDLALRLIDRGAILISDDQTMVRQVGAGLIASGFGTIQGKIEVRGLGIIDVPSVTDVPLALILELRSAVERLPLETSERLVAGRMLPVVAIAPFEASAAIKAELALKRVTR